MRFGCFLAPHHPIGESPMLLFRRDIALGAQLDELGYDEFWVGEHHSSGWETISSPELLLAAVGERTGTIRLGTGVISLPYHHPFNVAARLAQLDQMTRGRVIFGSGPGALPSDAHTLGIDPMVQRDRQDEAIGVIRRLLRGEDRFTHESDWFTLRDAQLQILPIQDEMEMATASSLSPSGMQLAGKYGMGVLSIASTSSEGLAALPTQWGFAERAAAEHGVTVDRSNWRVLMSWHLAETREQARKEAVHGLHRWHNEYNVDTLARPGAMRVEDPNVLMDMMAGTPGSTTVVGTPDDLVAAIRNLYEVTGGFGAVIGFAHDWANIENTRRSWDMVARYVIPEINGHLRGLRASQQFLMKNQSTLMAGASKAVLAKISSTPGAMEALQVTVAQRSAAASASTTADSSSPAGGTEWRPGVDVSATAEHS
jgi:limonene 1,2-monooxygenase